ncbi:Acetylcholinesterase 4 [Halotydeus destructor]|nr:Acetylcholinesterase 4 [Halotydeus destructor]
MPRLAVAIKLAILVILQSSFSLENVVETKYGRIRGRRILFKGKETNQFTGIPYARPPLKKLRFAKPVEPLPWSPKTLNATSDNITFCPETNDATKTVSEDCLYLTIWSPGDSERGKKYPVFLYFYGGDYDFFGAQYLLYNATYATRFDAIVVLPIFRGNVFGFFNGNRTDAPGNLGLWDQAMVVKWIHENIADFGGDPDRVTVSGGSSGSASALVLAISPVSQRYLRNVLLVSNSLAGLKPGDVIADSKQIAANLGCNVSQDYVACLRRVSMKALLTAKANFTAQAFSPNIGDEIFPLAILEACRQGRFNSSTRLLFGGSLLEYASPFQDHCPVIDTLNVTGKITRAEVRTCLAGKLPLSVVDEAVNHYLAEVDDSDNEAVRKICAKSYGDYAFTCPTYFSALSISEMTNSSNVFAFFLSYGPEVTSPFCEGNITWPRPCHSEELVTTFGEAYLRPDLLNATDRIQTDHLITMWSSFACTGRPVAPDGQHWPAFQEAPLPPLTPVNLGSTGRPVWPNYLDMNPLHPQTPAQYKPYKDCDTFWVKHKEVFNYPPAVQN